MSESEIKAESAFPTAGLMALNAVRIEVAEKGRGLSIPVGLIVAADRVFRRCLFGGVELRLTPIDALGANWSAVLGDKQGAGATPWGAIASLAERLGV